jgi:hypothetical protein
MTVVSRGVFAKGNVTDQKLIGASLLISDGGSISSNVISN